MIIHDDTLTPEDLEALQFADKFCERSARGIPPDRWATTRDMHKVARAIQILYAMAYVSCADTARAQYDAGLRSMRLDGEE